MPYTTCVAGTVITAAWANANIRDQAVTPFVDAAARDAAITSPVEGMVAYLRDVDYHTTYLGGNWVALNHAFAATVAASETTTSTSFTDLATVGPWVSVDTGTSALVIMTAQQSCSVADGIYASFDVSGATTVAASTSRALSMVGSSQFGMSASFVITGLTPGTNLFTMRYRIAFSGTGTWVNRGIIVIPL